MALPALGLFSSACGAAGPVSELSQTYTAAPGAALVIDNDNGLTTVVADASTAALRQVLVEVRFEGEDDIDFSVTEGAAELKIKADGKSGGIFRRSPKADITVTVPPGMAVKAGSGNGSVTISGIDSSSINASTGNGSITLEAVRADVFAATGNGSITVKSSKGSFNLTTGNGSISLAAELPAGGENRLTTGNGSVTVELAGELNLALDAKSDNGKVTSSLPLTATETESGRILGHAGDGSAKITIRSGNGQITLRAGG
jgi:DUF4097 and DUF4098 domain-containing protein YvlB